MATEDQILLKLVIQGQDPAEIQRLAASTQGQLNDRIKVYLDHLTELHKDANAAQTEDKVNSIKKQIDAAEKQVDVVSKVMRANEIAANRATNAWKGTLEVMENISTSARFMFDIVSGGLDRFKQLGDAIDRVTNVYGSLKGSIDEMREASRGEISDYDLIATKNRALEKDLQLTDTQFGIAAAAADNYADSIGVNTKEALDKLIDGLVQGRLKTLSQAGVVIDAKKTFDEYAKSIGVAGDQLSDHGKKVAIIQTALKQMDENLVKSGISVDNFSHTWEQTSAKLTNIWNTLLKGIGELVLKAIEGFTVDLPDAIRLGIAKIKDLMPGSHGEAVEAAVAAHDANLAKFYQTDNTKQVEDAKTRLENPSESYKYAGAGNRADSINAAKVAEDAKKAEAARKKQDEINAMFDDFLRKMGGLDKATIGGKDEDLDGLATRIQSADEKAVGASFDPGASRNALSGRNNEFARQQTLQSAQARMQENIARSMEAPKETNDLSSGVDSKGALDRMEKAMNDAQNRLDDLRKRGGDGILSAALFGTEGPGGMKDKLHTFSQDAADALGMVTDAGMKMGEALGGALAAFVSGDKTKRASIRQTTHDILEALSTQAYSRAIFETAEGLASLALGPIGGVSAGMHFAAAGMFTAVGTTAGLGARAIGTSPTAASGTGAGTGTTAGSASGVTTGSGFGSGGVRAANGGNMDNSQPLTINLNVMPGGEAEAGRQINKALSAYYSQTGQGLAAAMVTA